jgi:hypothetical protein
MFLIINIFLSYQLYTISTNQYKYIEKEELQSVIEYLNNKNIQVNTEIPDRVLMTPSIRVKYYAFDSKKIEGIFFQASNSMYNNTIDGFEMKNDNITVTVKDRIYVSYRNEAISIKQRDVNEKQCIDNAYRFINNLKLNSGNQYLKTKDIQKGFVRLVIGQQFNKIPVESSEIEIIATEDGILQADISWFEWIESDNRHNIITPVMAILKAFEGREKDAEVAVINEIRQGYYFNPIVKDATSADIVLEGTVSPMWVIVSDKKEIYINAYNEKIEKD